MTKKKKTKKKNYENSKIYIKLSKIENVFSIQHIQIQAYQVSGIDF